MPPTSKARLVRRILKQRSEKLSADDKSKIGRQPFRSPQHPCLAEAGLTLDLVVQLCLKTLFFTGELSGSDLSSRLGLAFSVIDPALEALKAQRQCEITGGGMLGGSAYRYRITDAGRARALLFLEQNHYVGRAPVPLDQYRQYMHAFGEVRRKGATPPAVRKAFSHLVVPERVLDQLGPAINAGHSLFVYGLPGTARRSSRRRSATC